MNIPLNIDWQQILLHLLNFTVLFAVLYFLLYKPVKDFMGKRQEYFEKLEGDAKSALEEGRLAKEEYLNKLEKVEEEALLIKEKAHKEIEESRAAQIKQAETEAKKIISEAHFSAEKEHAKILKEAQNEISKMVADATEKIVLNSTTSDAYDSFLNHAKRSESDE